MFGKLETRVGIFVLAALAVFAYMGLQIGAFRFDKGNYHQYVMYFRDISGLTRKAEVKIAGVKVGWTEDIKLIANQEMQAQVTVMVRKEYKLYQDAHAIVRQDGFLGPKYLEVVPGCPLLATLAPGDTLSRPSTEPVSVDDLLQKFKTIASNVEDITESFKGALGGPQGRDQLKNIFGNLDTTTRNLATFTDVLERSFVRNEDNIDAFLAIGTEIRKVADTLTTDVLPSFTNGVNRISHTFERDFNRVADKFESTADALEGASRQASEGFKSVTAIAEKIDEGKGLLGKLINEEETYTDLKVAMEGLKNYFGTIDLLEIVFDSHFETMQRPSDIYQFEDSKGYFDIRVHPNADRFYLIQVAVSERGFITRSETRNTFTDGDDQVIDPQVLLKDNSDVDDYTKFNLIYNRRVETTRHNAMRIGAQFGKAFSDIALRFGLFEGSAGIGVDFDIPFNNENFRWVTSFEAFELSGWNHRSRELHRRPHLKWLNRMFIMDNIYVTFGADDFVSVHNANAFVGAGVRFGDEEVKYLLSSVGGLQMFTANS